MLDSYTERLNVYGPDLRHLFTFGTPVADGTTAEFYEPWGMAFWPDATGNGGRLFINDIYNRRIVIYRPVNGPANGNEIGSLQLDSVIKSFVAPSPLIDLFSLAVDPSNGFIAVTDTATPRVVVLQRPALAAFDVQVLDPSNNAIESVCAGDPYKIRFSLTVPAGYADVTGVVPRLEIDGLPTSAPAVPSANYPSSTLSAGQVVTYTYTLAAPGAAAADIHVIAGATATSTADILMRSEMISLGNCAGETDPSTISANPSTMPQVSRWTPVFEGEPFTVALVAQDNDGIESIEYQLTGANDTGDVPVSTPFNGVQSDAGVPVAIEGFGRTTILYRVRDGNQIWSPWKSLAFNLKLVINRVTSENDSEVFRLGEPDVAGVAYSVFGLPEGATFSTATGQFGGIISFAAHDQYSANPAVASGEYTVVVTETAPGGATSDVTFHWTVNNINRPPSMVGVADQVGMEGDAVSVQIVASDADGDPLGDWNVTGLPFGLSLSQTGLITGTLPLGSAGVYYPVHVSVTDGSQPSVVTFKWTVKKLNLAPVGISDTYATAEDTPLTQSVPGVLGNDTDDAGMNPLTAILVAGPSHGTLALNAGGSFVYTPAANFHGTDGFTYKVSDGSLTSADTTVTITVTSVNDPPAAVGDGYITAEDTPLTVAAPGVLGNDSDIDADPLTAILATVPSHGTVALNSNGSFVYTPAANFNGDDAFSYRANDGSANSAAATVKIKVSAVNDAPTVSSPNRNSNEGEVIDVTITGSDVDSNPLTFSAANLPPGLAMAANGAVTGTISFETVSNYLVTVTVSDGAAQSSATFNWTVADTNRAPTAGADTASVVQGQSVSINVLGNDSDPDGTALTVASVTLLSGGGSAVIAPGGTITYTAAPTSVGATFNYRVTDGSLSASALVTVTVLPSNLPPICVATATPSVIWPPNHQQVYLAVAGVTDPEGGALTIRYTGILQDEPTDSAGDGNTLQDGGIENNGARVWVRAERGGTGDGRVYLVTYTATDPALASCTGVVTLRVPHDQGGAPAVLSPGRWNSITGQQVSGFLPPDAVNDAVTVKKGEAQTIAVLSNDIANGQTLTVAIVTHPSAGLATLTANGTITYLPPASFTGTTSFTYRVTTPSGGTDTATVTVTIKK